MFHRPIYSRISPSALFSGICLLLLLFGMPIAAHAEEPDGTKSRNGKHLEDDFQMWAPTSLQINVTPKLYTTLTIQPRMSNNWKEFTQIISNELVGYKITKNVAAEVGHEFNNRFDWEDDGTGLQKYLYENRLYQGITLTHRRKKTEWTFRNRLEERWIGHNNGMALRSRHLLGVRRYLGKEQKWYLAANNEIFINLASVTGENLVLNGINQNRAFVGIGRKVNDNLTMEAGYMMQYVNNVSPKDDNMNHILQLKTMFQVGKK